jgi:glycosyltransferase involved in cell wall biosynthesis
MRSVGVSSRHHGTWPTIRLGQPTNVSFEEAHLFPQGVALTRGWSSLQRLCRACGVVRDASRFDLLHSYQTVLLNDAPWVVSFDALLPFYPRPYIHKALHDALLLRLARENCRAILPHSRHALNLMRSRATGSQALRAIERKTMLVYPAVTDCPSAWRQSLARDRYGDGVKLLFVGRQFFQKGGHLLLHALGELQQTHRLKLTVVSDLNPQDWTAGRTAEVVKAAKSSIQRLQVRHFENLPNDRVRALMGEADLLVLPSIDETFGFVILEAFASGLPVLGTSWNAMAELIRPTVNGFQIQAPTDSEGRLDRSTGNHEQLIAEQIFQILSAVCRDPAILNDLKAGARANYEEMFQPARLARDLEQAYSL